MTNSTKPESAGSPSRAAVREVALSLVLVLVSSLVGIPLLALVAFRIPSLGVSRVELLAVPCFLVGSALAGWLLRALPSSRSHSTRWLFFSAALGSLGAYLTGMALGPWPDLLSDDVLGRGWTALYLEAGKTIIPWVAGAVIAFALLRYDSFRASSKR